MSKVYIVLEDGRAFEGKRFGADGDVTGELVFTTGVCGYMETLTDPNYYGQIVMQTFPLIGNYGVIKEDTDGRKPFLSGYIVREWCEAPSNFRCEEDLDKYLKENNIVGVCGPDTRELTRIIRENGVMNAAICSDPELADMDALKKYKVHNAVKSVCGDVSDSSDAADTADTNGASAEAKYKIVMIDYGSRHHIANELCARDCAVTTVPYDISAEAVLDMNPDGIVLTDGPGDPKENKHCIEQIKKLVGKFPIVGVGLGHQLLALACGGRAKKLKYGHRGANQPVKDNLSGRTYMTSQNHGYTIVNGSVDESVGTVRYINVNDGSCEGLDYPEAKALSVQFIPDGSAGTIDADMIYGRFISLIGGNRTCR